MEKKERSIAIVGSGPRGMSVLERLAARLSQNKENEIETDIYLIDNGFVGTGRVWSIKQSPYLLMNTIAQEISAFSGPWDGKEAKPGNGPSFAEWWKIAHDDYEQYEGYGPRAYYGEYLLYVLDAIEKSLPENVKLHKISGQVINIDNEKESSQTLYLEDGSKLVVNKTIITTGHAVNELHGLSKELSEFALRVPEVKFIQGNSVADMDLEVINPGDKVGVIGMGLSFYDLMGQFTLGRGGEFVPDDKEGLVYKKSGKEPLLFAGSRSGMPVPARGKNQKPYNYEYDPAIFTKECAMKIRNRKSVKFEADVLPLIEAEVALVYAETIFRNEGKNENALELRKRVRSLCVQSVEGVETIARSLGMRSLIHVNLYDLTKPFKNCEFSSLPEFNKLLSMLLENDYDEAMKGNIGSSLKASLDVIRNIRSVIREVVDYGGLNPESYQKEFLKSFAPASNFLAAGPPAFRIAQLNALIRAGIVTIIGPSVEYKISEGEHCIRISSPQVKNSDVMVKTVIDARIPAPDLHHECSEFTKALVRKGIYAPFVNRNDGIEFETNGVNVTKSPFHPIGKDGSIYRNIYVLGIPTEYIRWFMQSGSTRPHKWIDFMVDADAIAEDALKYI